jgi:hypothetical protein
MLQASPSLTAAATLFWQRLALSERRHIVSDIMSDNMIWSGWSKVTLQLLAHISPTGLARQQRQPAVHVRPDADISFGLSC